MSKLDPITLTVYSGHYLLSFILKVQWRPFPAGAFPVPDISDVPTPSSVEPKPQGLCSYETHWKINLSKVVSYIAHA